MTVVARRLVHSPSGLLPHARDAAGAAWAVTLIGDDLPGTVCRCRDSSETLADTKETGQRP